METLIGLDSQGLAPVALLAQAGRINPDDHGTGGSQPADRLSRPPASEGISGAGERDSSPQRGRDSAPDGRGDGPAMSAREANELFRHNAVSGLLVHEQSETASTQSGIAVGSGDEHRVSTEGKAEVQAAAAEKSQIAQGVSDGFISRRLRVPDPASTSGQHAAACLGGNDGGWIGATLHAIDGNPVFSEQSDSQADRDSDSDGLDPAAYGWLDFDTGKLIAILVLLGIIAIIPATALILWLLGFRS